MKVAFFTNRLSRRGTEVALFDYAKYNKHILGNESFIVTNTLTPTHHESLDKFNNEFGGVLLTNTIYDIEKFIEKNKIDVMYKICEGCVESIPTNCKVAVHVVFNQFDPFGHVYAYVSEWLRNHNVPVNRQANYDYVPHMIDMPPPLETLRKSLNIHNDCIVYGYHGGGDSFNIKFVQEAVYEMANEKNIKFIFMNVDRFCNHENVLFLPGSTDMQYKANFIETCDAMIYARSRGETFGISIGEFSIMNKPIIAHNNPPEKSHLSILGDKAILYSDKTSLKEILRNFTKTNGNYDCYSQEFSKYKVMDKFKKVFLL